jgi:Type I phosphodiesterase / nucleotide pyrophosphatase
MLVSALCAAAVLWATQLGAADSQYSDGRPDVKHFIVIGVDGLSVDAVLKTRSPHMHALMERGAWTLKARGVMPTLSSPNWASMIMGAGPEQHGITSNGYLTKMVEIQPVCHDSSGLFPTIFEVLREARPTSKVAIFHDWGGFANLVESRAPSVIRHEKGAARTMSAALNYWREEQPTLMFIHLDSVDHAGHDTGWNSFGYYRTVEEADQLIGQAVAMLEELGAFRDTVILITSDHGGKGTGHGKNSLNEIQIPWILAGAGVQRGEIAHPVNIFDTAPTIAWLFRLVTPDCWVGRPVQSAFAGKDQQNAGTRAVATERQDGGSTAPGQPTGATAISGSPVGSGPTQ